MASLPPTTPKSAIDASSGDMEDGTLPSRSRSARLVAEAITRSMSGATGELGPPSPESSTCSESKSVEASAEAPTAAVEQLKRDELRNCLLLGLIFTLYFGLRSGCAEVLPSVCKNLLQAELGGAEISPLYQLPIAVWFVMDIFLSSPNAILMRRCGRRIGFAIGGVAMSLGGALSFVALVVLPSTMPWTSFAMLVVAAAVMGEVGVCEFVRFAAAEACPDAKRRSLAVSRVLLGGAVLSMVGPFTAIAVQSQIEDPVAAKGFFFLIVAGGGGMIMTLAGFMIRLPPPTRVETKRTSTIAEILCRPKVFSAILAQVTVQFCMVAPMTGVALAMKDSKPELLDTGVQISGCIVAHVLCMFLPGLVTGELIVSVGRFPVMASGLALQVFALMISLTGVKLINFYSCLMVLGIGWNFAFVSGTMLLLDSHTVQERTVVTSANEALRFAANAAGALLSSSVSWDTLSWVCLASLLPAFVVLVAQRHATKE